MLVPPAPFDDGYGVRDARAIRDGKQSARTIPVLIRPAEGLRLSRSYNYLAGARLLRITAVDNRSNPPIPRWEESLRAE